MKARSGLFVCSTVPSIMLWKEQALKYCMCSQDHSTYLGRVRVLLPEIQLSNLGTRNFLYRIIVNCIFQQEKCLVNCMSPRYITDLLLQFYGTHIFLKALCIAFPFLVLCCNTSSKIQINDEMTQ